VLGERGGQAARISTGSRRPKLAELLATPALAVNGALTYQGKMCGTCHMADGVGMKIGPPPNGLDNRGTRGWIVKHFNDPQGCRRARSCRPINSHPARWTIWFPTCCPCPASPRDSVRLWGAPSSSRGALPNTTAEPRPPQPPA
jgi:hypothetical protein